MATPPTGSLPEKRERFAQEYVVDLNATQAAIRAGYSARTARAQGSRLLTNVDVQERVRELQAARAERVQIDADWVLARLVENVDRAMQKTAAEVDQEGNITEYRYEGSVANKALELIARHLGMLRDRVDLTVDDRQRIEALATQFGLSVDEVMAEAQDILKRR